MIAMEGEFLSLEEFIVVSPGWGRFRRMPMTEGGRIDRGTVLGRIENGGPDVPIVSPVEGVFRAWMVWADEPVAPGAPIARIVPEEKDLARGRG